MTGFPDESAMPRSADGTEPVRGGSVGFNRILNRFVVAAGEDTKPAFHGVIISAFTIFRNVYSSLKDPTFDQMEDGFVKDVDLFLEYFNIYLSYVWSRLASDKFVPVLIYFPDYHHIPKEIQKDYTDKQQAMMTMYRKFLDHHGQEDRMVKQMDHIRCWWMSAGKHGYPHLDAVKHFQTIASHRQSIYTSGDDICLITHITLDLHMARRLRGIRLLESYTAKIRKADEFKLRLTKNNDGYVPFLTSTHVALGDDTMIKSLVSSKARRDIVAAAEKDKWITRGEEDIRNRIAKIAAMSVMDFRKYDFT